MSTQDLADSLQRAYEEQGKLRTRAEKAESALTAAQDRVRVLEAALSKARDLAEDEANITLHPDHQMYQRTLLARDIVEALS